MARVAPWLPVFVGPLLPLACWALALPAWVDDGRTWVREVAVIALHAVVVHALALLVPSRVGRTIALGLAGLWLALVLFVKAGFFHLYGSTLTTGAFHVVLETNLSESGDFVRVQFDAVIGCTVAGLVAWWILQLVSAIRGAAALHALLSRGGWWARAGLILVAAGAGTLVATRLATSDPVGLAIEASRRYEELHQAFGTKLATPFNPSLRGVVADGGIEVGVVVIGESTSARHLGLHGYWRDTTPALGAIRDELLVFGRVASPHSHTIASLLKVLTLASLERPDAAVEGSVIQLANAAGFETTWISNQRPVGINETLVTAMSRAARSSRFVGMLTAGRDEHDGILLPHLREALRAPGGRRIIFLHLMGAHQDYAKRFPPEFRRFDDEPRTPFPSPRSREAINDYDNAVLYWDHVCRRVIEEVRATGKRGFVVLTSDHGEDVFQEMEGMGHSEERGTTPMFEVPFIVWRSGPGGGGDLGPREVLEARPWVLEDFIHAFADLAGIRFEGHDPTRSIVGGAFKARPRRVGVAGKDLDAR